MRDALLHAGKCHPVSERAITFGGLTIRYDGGVLEPRPWTIEQSRWAVELARDAPPGPLLELCAGVGHIGLVVARRTGRSLVQVDVDDRACELAQANARAAGIPTDVRCGEVDAVIRRGETFALVLADPPYIESPSTGRYGNDPALAIDGGDDGLAVARRCLATIASHLDGDGVAVLQLGGPGQAAELARELGSYGLEEVERRTHGADRALVGLRRC